VPFFTFIENLKGVIFSMTFTKPNKYILEYDFKFSDNMESLGKQSQIDTSINDRIREGSIDALCKIFDFINNSNSDINPKEIMVFITDEITKRGGQKLRIKIEE